MATTPRLTLATATEGSGILHCDMICMIQCSDLLCVVCTTSLVYSFEFYVNCNSAVKIWRGSEESIPGLDFSRDTLRNLVIKVRISVARDRNVSVEF